MAQLTVYSCAPKEASCALPREPAIRKEKQQRRRLWRYLQDVVSMWRCNQAGWSSSGMSPGAAAAKCFEDRAGKVPVAVLRCGRLVERRTVLAGEFRCPLLVPAYKRGRRRSITFLTLET